MKKKAAVMLIVIFLISVATSFSVQAQTVVLPPTPAPTQVVSTPLPTPVAPTPRPTLIANRAFSGSLLYEDGTPKANAVMRLATVFDCDESGCDFYLDGSNSPATITNHDGGFMFTEIEPRMYVLLVHDLLWDAWWLLAADDDGQEVWSVVEADLDVGTIIFDKVDSDWCKLHACSQIFFPLVLK